MSAEEKKKEPIKVTDRRSFTPEGERRASVEPEEEKSPVLGEGFEIRRETQPEPQEPSDRTAQVDFISFILSLTSTAFIQLGEVEDPVQGSRGVDLEGARQMIDIIDMLHEKTRGNLEPQEEKFMERILFELKVKFSQAASSAR